MHLFDQTPVGSRGTLKIIPLRLWRNPWVPKCPMCPFAEVVRHPRRQEKHTRFRYSNSMVRGMSEQNSKSWPFGRATCWPIETDERKPPAFMGWETLRHIPGQLIAVRPLHGWVLTPIKQEQK